MEINGKNTLWISLIAAVISIALSAAFLDEGTKQSFYYWIWFGATLISGCVLVIFALLNLKYKTYEPYQIVIFAPYPLLFGIVSAVMVISNSVSNSFLALIMVILISNVLVFLLPRKLRKEQ